MFRQKKPIVLRLTFLGYEPDNNGVAIGWSASGEPDDIMFDIDFVGHPSGVTTGFAWDASSATLNDVFAVQGDLSFRISIGWAYSGNQMDGSGKVKAAWSVEDCEGAELKFVAGAALELFFEFAPTVGQVREV